MAQKLYELALEIQGKLDSSFSGAMKSAQGDIKALEGEVKAWQDRQKNVSGIDAAYVKAREGARQLGGELAKLKKQQDAVSEYQSQRKATTEAARAYRNVQREVRALTAAYAKDKTPANKKAMQEAAKQAKALEREYNKNKNTLTKMGEKLKAAGVDTRNLSGEQERLAQKISNATKEQERYNRAADRVTLHKAFWADLTGKVREYSGHVMSAVKWTAGIGTALATGAYMVTKSAAEKANEAAKAAKKARTDAETYQKIEFIASLSGVKDIETALVTMNRNISEVATKGKGKAADMLNRLRFNTKEFLDMNAEEKLIALSEAFQKIESESNKTTIAKAFFGGQEAEMREFLRNSPEQIRAFMREAENLGLVIKNEDATAAESFIDNVDRLQRSIQGLKNTIGIELMPVFDDIVKRTTAWIQENREFVGKEVKEWADWLVKKLPDIWEEFKKGTSALGDFLEVVSKCVDKVGGFSNVLLGLGAIWGTKKIVGGIEWAGGWLGKYFPAAGTATAAGTAGSALAGGAATTATTAAAGTTSAAAAGTATTAAASGGVLSALSTALMNLPLAGILGGTAYLALTTPEEAKKQALAEAGDFGLTPSWMREERPKTDAFVDAMMKLAEQRQISVSREDIQNEQGRLTANLQGQTTSRWFMSDEVSRLLDAALEERASLLPMFDELNEQAKLDVKREDVAQYSVQLMECVRGNEQAIRDLPERLRPILEVLRPAQSAIVEHHARGGFISTPTVSTLAERGGEMVIPTADADRGLGLSRLFEAARKLNVPVVPAETPNIGRDFNLDVLLGNMGKMIISSPLDNVSDDAPDSRWDLSHPLRVAGVGGRSDSHASAPVPMPDINLSQTFTITGPDTEGIIEQVGSVSTQAVIDALREYQDEMRRVDYAT